MTPYRQSDGSLESRERILEGELRAVRAQLHALTDEEVRLSRALCEVRGELEAQGRLRIVAAERAEDAAGPFPSMTTTGLLGLVMLCMLALLAFEHLGR